METHEGPEQEARRELALVASYADGFTRRRIEALGPREGWRCFEPGCGGGSVAHWLSQRVGSSGHVLAVDLSPRFALELAGPNLEVRQQDIVKEPPPEGAFDLVHARLLLAHLPQREQVLERLAASLRPGGWLMVEEQELFPMLETPFPVCRKLWEGIGVLMRAQGKDLAWARKVPSLLRRLGLVEIGTEVSSSLTAGGSPVTELWRLNLEHSRATLVKMRLLTEDQVNQADTLLRNPEHWFYGPAMVAVWGRRPL
jgi:SAM-dependent methyltransferase